MCRAQLEPGLTLLLVPAQHSCGIQASSSSGDHPSPRPAPAPALAPGGDKAPPPGPQNPGAQNPAAAYAGKGVLQCQDAVLAQEWKFWVVCGDISSSRAVNTPGWEQGVSKGPGRSCLLFPSLSLPRFSLGSEAGRDH